MTDMGVVGVGRSSRVLTALAVLVMALVGLGGAGTARAVSTGPARAGSVSNSQNELPSTKWSGVQQLCGPSASYSCDTDGYAGQSAGWWGADYGAGYASSNSYGYHNCTLYAAYRIAQNGVGDPGWSGNAYQWADFAAGHGTPVDQTPAVGAVAQWNRDHVAYVEAVTTSYIEITDDNFGYNTTDRFRISVGSPAWPDNFIHFADTHVGEIVQWNADPSRPQAAWRVGSDTLRHWIPTESVYECLVNGTYGANGPFEEPASWLDSVAKLDPGSTAPCGGDVNGDGIVNLKDLAILAAEWGHTGQGLHADLNLDGTVGLSDLSIMASQWGKAPSPIPIVSAPGSASTASSGLATSDVTMASVNAQMWAAVRRSTPLARPARPAVVARPAQAAGVGDVAGNGSSVTPSVSADGNLVAFSSFATNLVPNDENGSTADVFVWNRSAGTITLADTQPDGTQFTTPSEDAHISPNGEYVAFDSGGDVWVKDLRTGALLRISQPNADASGEPNEPAYADAVTSSGLVVFDSEATNLVSASGLNSSVMQVYARQLTDGPVQLVSVAPDGATAAGGNSFGGNASDDGRYVVFSSLGGNLTTDDTSGYSGVFERDLSTGTTTMLSVPQGGGQANGYSLFPSISANGSAVAFSSTATNLTASSDPAGVQQVYVAWPAIGEIYQASQAANGAVGNGDSTEPSISGDGTRVAFTSDASNLVSDDTNYSGNVYVRDLNAGLISRVSVSASLAQANNSSFGPSINGNGTVVTFPSFASNLGSAAAASAAGLAGAASSAAPVEQIVARGITLLPQNPTTVTITGTVKVGATLTAHAGTWDTQGGTLGYQWYANGAAIKGAARKTLTLAAGQYGKAVTVTVTSSLPGFAAASATSRPTVKVGAGTLTPVTPAIKGTVRAGDTLTVVPGAWKPAGVTFHYQWYVAGKAVSSGGTGPTLKLSMAWAGRTVTVKVTGTLAGYATVTVTSKPTGKIGG